MCKSIDFILCCVFFVCFTCISVNLEAKDSLAAVNKPILSDNDSTQSTSPVVVDAHQASETQAFNFRKAKWGYSKEETRQSEVLSSVGDAGRFLTYKDRICNLACEIAYIFGCGKLVRGAYLIEENHSNPNDYIADFQRLKSALVEKYGEPSTNDTIWKNSLLKNDPEQFGLAILSGHLVIFAKWIKGDSEIALGLSGDNFKVRLEIEYKSISLAELEVKEKRENDKGKL